jgi:uncharacterized membrane protein
MSKKIDCLSVASAFAGALTMASLATPAAAATIKGMEQCYGVAAAGQNSCASASGSHSCAGQSTVAYSGEEFRVVKDGVCKELGGKLKAFKGVDEEAMKAGGKPMKM